MKYYLSKKSCQSFDGDSQYAYMEKTSYTSSSISTNENIMYLATDLKIKSHTIFSNINYINKNTSLRRSKLFFVLDFNKKKNYLLIYIIKICYSWSYPRASSRLELLALNFLWCNFSLNCVSNGIACLLQIWKYKYNYIWLSYRVSQK